MSGETVNLGGTGAAAGDSFQAVTATLNLADATGASDAMTVNLVDTNAAATTTTITANGIETMTLALANSTEDHKIALNNTNADNAASLVVTGSNASADLTLTSIPTAFTTIDASGLAGKLTMGSSRASTAANTITSSTADDTIIMQQE